MNVSDTLNARRSIKRFDPKQRMGDADFGHLIDTALLSPTAFNLQHWRIVRIQNQELRKAIREVAGDQPQVTEASELLILCMNSAAWEQDPGQYWPGVAPEVAQYIVSAVDAYYRDKPEVQRDECMRSGGMIAMSLMLLAKEMGYASCPMDGFDFSEVGKMIHLPEDHYICMMLAIGKPATDPHPRIGRLRADQVLINNAFK